MADLPDEWKFLEQGPEEWQAPEDLRVPPKSPTMNLLLQILSSDFVGNRTLVAAAQMLSSYAALNEWLSVARQNGPNFEEVARISVEVSLVARDVYTAWAAFREAFEPVRRAGVADSERSLLLLALESGTKRIDKLRQVEES